MITVFKTESADSQGFVVTSLAKFLDQDPGSITLNKLPSGQPVLVGEKLSFSLSHSDELLALAASKSFDVGIDIQKHRTVNPGLFRRICSDTELAGIKEQDLQTFFKIWTIKEASLKCIGMGLQYPMNLLEIDFHKQQVKVTADRPGMRMVFAGDQKLLSYKEIELFPEATAHIVWSSQNIRPKISIGGQYL